MKNKTPLILTFAFAILFFPLQAAESFNLRGYGIADPSRYATSILI
ncbi:MAG: hypothetical protein JNM63_16850, partial [Spirochaetia bacterium]|nr:hypothetical protein [Spirochaetia bacterium]